MQPVSPHRALTSALTVGSAFVLVAALVVAAGANAILPADDRAGEMLRDGGWFAIILYGGVAIVVAALLVTVGWHARPVERSSASPVVIPPAGPKWALLAKSLRQTASERHCQHGDFIGEAAH